MTILLIGSKGQLGQEIEKKGKTLFESNMVAMDLPEIDITDNRVLEKIFLNLAPSIVINTAAYTAVDLAETEKEICYAANFSGPSNLARLCKRNNATLIHISTDYVFNGKSNTPYGENDPVSPLGVYGESKAEGEKAVLAESDKHIIVRTSWLYGRYGKNFVKTMLRMGKEKDTLRVVSDQYGCPTCAADLAEAVLTVTGSLMNGMVPNRGIYHYCGEGVTTWYDFAVAIFDIAVELGFGPAPAIVPIPTEEYPTPAKRPDYSALDCTRIKRDFGIITFPWQKSLRKTIRDILAMGGDS